MKVIFIMFFLLVGFIGGFLFALNFTLDIIRHCAKNSGVLFDKYRVTLIRDDEQE